VEINDIQARSASEGWRQIRDLLGHRVDWICTLIFLSLASPLLGAESRVELELATEPGFDITQARAWSELLAEVGFAGVRIRSGRADDQPSIEPRQTGSTTNYFVRGILKAENQLLLPKGRFGLKDRMRIAQWVEKVKSGGEEAISTKPAAFGLLPKDLVTIHEALAVPVKNSTAGKPPREVAKAIADGLSLKFISDTTAQRALASEEPVGDELQDVSSGTALAAVLRPLGLALMPEKSGTDLRLRIIEARSAPEFWPVGWPPKGNPRETLPELFKILNVEITQASLAEALAAIGGRLKTPVLIDRNSIARDKVDLNAKVNLPKANTFYGAALDRLLGQARLKYELRVDEANKPFIWITTLRQP
jgi:hypothetical protein